LLLLAPALCAEGEEEIQSFPQAASRVIALVAAGDEAGFSALVGSGRFDPWLLADLVCAEGQYAAAVRVAEASGDVRLQEYIAARRGAPPRSLVREAHGLARENAIDGIRALSQRADGFERAAIYALLGELTGSADSYAEAARAAFEVGWLAQAEEALWSEGLLSHRDYDYPRMLAAWERLLESRKARGNAHGVAATLKNLASVHGELGRFDRALRLYDAAEEVARGIGDSEQIAWILSNRGVLLQRKGDFREAQRALERGLDIAKEDALRGTLLANLAVVENDLGANHSAAAKYALAIALAEKAGDLELRARALHDLGVVLDEKGDAAGALRAYEEARALFVEQEEPLGVAVATSNIGSARFALGEHEEARRLQAEALALLAPSGDPAHEATFRRHLARTLGALGRREEAEAQFARALEIAEEVGLGGELFLCNAWLASMRLKAGDAAGATGAARHALEQLARSLGGLAEGQGARARAAHAAVFETGVRASLATGVAADLCYFLEESRAGVLRESLAGSSTIREAAIPASLRTAEEEARAAVREAEAIYQRAVAEKERDAIRRRRDVLAAARSDLQAVSERIQREARSGADLAYPKADSLSRIRSRLRAGEALLLYGLSGQEAAVLVVVSDGARIVRLGPRAPIHDAALAPLSTESLAAIARLVIEPLGLDASVRRLLISPDGELFRVPFATVVGDREVAYVPSATTYGLLLESAGLRGSGILALGGADYSGRAEWSDLPGSAAEARAVGQRLLLGANANLPDLRTALLERARWMSVHLACHGRVDVERPMFSGLALTVKAPDDGFADVAEIFALRVRSDLVVLSACDTGLGAVYAGEGLVGLSRAFMFAGAPRVIASLWKVDDAATQELMTRFYALWKPGTTGAAAALRGAQQSLRADPRWEDPRYWAAWVLWGVAE